MRKKDTNDVFQKKRLEMVHTQIEARGIKEQALLTVMKEVSRDLFVPEPFNSMAYEDSALPIGYDQTISQPYIVAYMIEKAELKPSDRVLEIGTGSGYNAAVLGKLCKEVYTIELIPELSQKAGNILNGLGYKNVFLKVGDGALGWEQEAPFDAILITAAPDHVPQPLIEQLKVGGRLVMPMGTLMQQKLIRITKNPTDLQEETFFPVIFVPMKGSNDPEEFP